MGQVKIPNNASTTFSGPAYALYGTTPGGVPNPAALSFFCQNTGYGFVPTVMRNDNGPNGFHIYQGAMPTQAQLDAMSSVASYTTLASLPRYTDLLFYAIPTASAMVANQWQLAIPPAVAMKTGTAAWFMFYVSWSTNLGNACVVGSLSTIGGGGDIELLTLDFKNGSLYKLPQISIPFPTKFSW